MGFAVALFTANLQGFGHLDVSVFDLCVTGETVHLVLFDVFIMEEFRVAVFLHPLNVTGEAPFSGDVTGAFCNIYMALIAVYAKFQVGFMGERKAFVLDYLGRHPVAGRATGG